MITDEDVEKAIDYLRDSAWDAAQSRANRIYMDEFRKSLKALIMKEHAGLSIGAQEREAYADKRYQDHLDALKTAVAQDERNRFMRVAAEAKIEAWRSFSANHRAIKL
jgi:hypothetical protein